MWKDLTLRQRALLIQMGVRAGIGSANTIRKLYDLQNTFATGGVKPKIQVSGTFADSETGDYRHPIEAARQKLFPYYKDYVASLNKSGDPLDDAALYYNFHQMMLDAFDDLERAYGNRFNDMTDMQQAALLSAYFQGKKEGRNIVGKGSPFYYSYIQGSPVYDYIKAPTGPENALRKMWWEYKDTHPFTVDKEGYNRFGEAMSFNLPEAVIEAPRKSAPTTPTPPIDWEYNEEVAGIPPLQEKQKEENEKPILKKVVREKMPGFDPEALYTNFGDRDNYRYKTFKYELDPDKVIMDNKALELKNLETVGFLQRMLDIYSPVEDEFYVNPMLKNAYGGNLYPDGGSKSSTDWHSLYPGIKYNTDLNSIKNDPLFSTNELGEVIYPSFDKWANGNKWDDIAPSYMSLGYDKPMTYGELYDNMASVYGLYNTALRTADRKAHPEKYTGDLHNYINRERRRQGLSSLGDNGVAEFLDSGIRGLVNMAGTAMQAPLELGKTFMVPGTYIPYYGAIDKRMQPVYDNVDTAVGGVFSAMNPFNYVDWGSAGMEGPHTKWFWQPNSNNVETPAAIEAAGFAAMPYVAKGLGKAGKYVKNKYTDWFDPYTSFNANFGYYGNPMQRFWGTIARKFNLPDKARLPEVLRKQDGDVRPMWSGRKPGHVNMTIDRGVVPHSNGTWLERDLYITDPTTVFNEEIIPSLKSIEPSDVFVDGMSEEGIALDPSKTTIVSGNVVSLELAKQQGMSTLSSKRARELYEKATELDAAAAAAEKERNPTSRFSLEKPKYKDVVNFTNNYWIEYAKELQRLQSRRGTPTLKDIKALEDMTGLEAHVKPIEEFSIFKDNVLKWFSNPSKYERPIYPNGNPVTGKMWILKSILDGSDFPYNKIFYDRSSPIEFNTPGAWLGGVRLKAGGGKLEYSSDINLQPKESYTSINIWPKKSSGKQVRIAGKNDYPIYTGRRFLISDVVNPDGTVNPRAAVNVQHTIADSFGKDAFTGNQAFRMEDRLENPKWHKNDKTTYDHTKLVTLSAYWLPIPEGFTKLAQMAAALAHDVGKILAGDGHEKVGAALVEQAFPNAPKELVDAVAEHMGSNQSTSLGTATRAADIANGNMNSLKYDLEIIDILNSLRNKYEVTKVYSPQHLTILKKYSKFPELFKKLYKNLEVRIVTDRAGNTWYEVDIPDAFFKQELKFSYGGNLYPDGGDLEEPTMYGSTEEDAVITGHRMPGWNRFWNKNFRSKDGWERYMDRYYARQQQSQDAVNDVVNRNDTYEVPDALSTLGLIQRTKSIEDVEREKAWDVYNRWREHSEILGPHFDPDGNYHNDSYRNSSAGYLSPADPMGSFAVELAASGPLFELAGRGLQWGLGRLGNLWARNQIAGRAANNAANKAFGFDNTKYVPALGNSIYAPNEAKTSLPYTYDGTYKYMITPKGKKVREGNIFYRDPVKMASKENNKQIQVSQNMLEPEYTPNINNVRKYADPVRYSGFPSNYNVYNDYVAMPMMLDNAMRAVRWLPEKLLPIAEEYLKTGNLRSVLENNTLSLAEKRTIADLGRMNSFAESDIVNSYYETFGDMMKDHPSVAKWGSKADIEAAKNATGVATYTDSELPIKAAGRRDIKTKPHEADHNIQVKFGMDKNLKEALHKAFPHSVSNKTGRISGNKLRGAGSAADVSEKGATATDIRTNILDKNNLPLDTPMSDLNNLIDNLSNEQLLDYVKSTTYGKEYFKNIMDQLDTYDFNNLRNIIKYGYAYGGNLNF